jgi:integrase
MSKGVGRIYLRGRIYWIQFSHRGKKHRESTKSPSEAAARRLLRKRIVDADVGKLPTTVTRRTTLKDLAELVYESYRANHFDSLARQEDAFNHLAEFFGWDALAESISSTRLKQEYVPWRKEQPSGICTRNPRIGCSDATINRELAALRHSYRLASEEEPPLVATVPKIKLLQERNRRVGFLEWNEFDAVRRELPAYLKAPVTTAYYTGWRFASEVLTRERKHVSNGMLVLDVYEGKNEEPRLFPLDVIPELREIVDDQLETTRRLEAETGRVIRRLFHNQGEPIVSYARAWHGACARAGLSGKIPHDFRRTAAHNLIGAGVDPFTTCQLVGWKSMAMLKRYNIIDEETLKRRVAKLVAHVEEQKRRPAKVAAIK